MCTIKELAFACHLHYPQKIFALLTQAALLEPLPNISLKPSALGEGALRLQVCVNAVKFAIIANLIALGSVLEAVCTTRALCSFQWRWCLEKDIWAESERTLRAVVDTCPPPFHLAQFHCFVLFGLTAIPIPRMTPWMIQCYHLSSSYRRCGNWPADHPAFFVLSFVVVCLFCVCFWFWLVFCFVCLFCLCFFCWHRDSQLDFVLVLPQFNFWSPPSWRWMTSLH